MGRSFYGEELLLACSIDVVSFAISSFKFFIFRSLYGGAAGGAKEQNKSKLTEINERLLKALDCSLSKSVDF